MTKKDYIAIGTMLANSKYQNEPTNYLVMEFDKYFEKDNPRYNSDKFLEFVSQKIKDLFDYINRPR